MSRRKTDDLVGKRRVFADLMVKGVSRSAAFEQSGISQGTDNAGHRHTVDKLLEDPAVRDHIINRLGKYGVSMQLLGNKLMGIVDDIADRYSKGEVTDRDALVCVTVGLKFIIECKGTDVFTGADQRAKELMTRADMARKILGEPIDVKAEEVAAQLVPGPIEGIS